AEHGEHALYRARQLLWGRAAAGNEALAQWQQIEHQLDEQGRVAAYVAAVVEDLPREFGLELGFGVTELAFVPSNGKVRQHDGDQRQQAGCADGRSAPCCRESDKLIAEALG